MSRRYLFFVGGILIFYCIFSFYTMFFYKVFASDVNNVFLSSSKDRFEIGEDIDVLLNLNSGETCAFTSYLYFDVSKLEYVSGPENSNVVGNCVIYVWYDSTGGNGATNGILTEFKFRAKNNGVANFSVDGEFFNKLGEEMKVNFGDLHLLVGSESQNFERKAVEEIGTDSQVQNVELKVLRLDREGMVPNFNVGVYEYYLTVLSDVNYIDVFAVAENSNASIEITGNSNLVDGLNTITVKVVSADKTQSKEYNIYVTKTSDVELANTNLEILAVENVLMYPQFDTNITNYNLEVSNEVSFLNVLAVPENEKAIVEVKGNEKLNDGNNLINITVTALNGFSKRVYVINAYKRNSEEEVLFKEEQKANQEDLKELYEVEKIDKENTEVYEQQGNVKQTNMISGVSVIVVVILISIILLTIKNQLLTKKSK